MKRSTKILGLAGILGLTWAGATVALATGQRKLVFNPAVEPEVDRPASAAHRTRKVVLRAEDGTRLAGWLLTPPTVGPHPAVIYFGGRSEEVSWVVRDASRLFPGMTVLALNYRGYGSSLGSPSESDLVNDGKMLFSWLSARTHVDPKRIAVVGRSLGSGVALQVAGSCPARALALVTPYDSILALAKRKFWGMPVGLILRHPFDSASHASRVDVPTLVLRAETDDIVPHAHTDLLVSKLVTLHEDSTIEGSDHCNIPYLPETQDRIANFLRSQLFA